MSTTITVTSRDFIDLDFNFERHPLTSNVSVKRNVNAIKQSIRHLLLLRKNDVPFHPEIESPIYRFLFENNTAATRIVLQNEVLRYLNRYEPRIDITDVVVSYPDPNSISCDIIGTILNTNTQVTINILVDRLR